MYVQPFNKKARVELYSTVQRGFRVQRGSVGSALACCIAGPS